MLLFGIIMHRVSAFFAHRNDISLIEFLVNEVPNPEALGSSVMTAIEE